MDGDVGLETAGQSAANQYPLQMETTTIHQNPHELWVHMLFILWYLIVSYNCKV